MKRTISVEFIYQLFSLLAAIIVVHAIYVAVIRPNTEAIRQEQRERIAMDPTYAPEQSWYVILSDYEQESCVVLMLWAFSILGYKAWLATRERDLLQQELIPLTEGMRILPEDTRQYARHLQALPADQQRLLLPRALSAALHRFGATRNVRTLPLPHMR